MDAKHVALEILIDTRLKGIEVATEKALVSNDIRLEGMNGFRNTLRDQTGTFLTKNEFVAQHDRMREDIQRLEISKAELQGKASVESIIKVDKRSVISQYISVAGVIVAVLALIVTIIYKG